MSGGFYASSSAGSTWPSIFSTRSTTNIMKGCPSRNAVLQLMIKVVGENQTEEVVPMELEPEPSGAEEPDDDLFASIDAAANAAEAQGVQQVVSVEEQCKAEMQRHLLLPRLQVLMPR